jgi:hypothetical protein
MFYIKTLPAGFSENTNNQIIVITTDASGVVWSIPPDPANSDYQQYLAWVAEGNIAEEWNPEENI